MSGNIRFPNITGVSEAEQLIQIKSYLYQLVEQLNWMLPTIESSAGQTGTSSTDPAYGVISAETFYELKSLLIKSSDTLNAYYEKINAKLEGQYVAQSAFDGYKQEVLQQFDGLGSKYVEQTAFNAFKKDNDTAIANLDSKYVAQAAFDSYKQNNDAAIANLDSKYVSKAEHDEYKQGVSQQFSELGNQYVTQAAFDTFKQDNDAAIANLDSKYVAQAAFDGYKQEVSQTITDLQKSVDELQQIINSMQETGG